MKNTQKSAVIKRLLERLEKITNKKVSLKENTENIELEDQINEYLATFGDTSPEDLSIEFGVPVEKIKHLLYNLYGPEDLEN